LGIKITEEKGIIKVHGKGLYGFSEPDDILDMGNSGTTTRLTLGLLSGQKFFSALTGDESLRKRPMKRVTHPLKQMNAKIDGRKNGELLPLSVRGSDLKGIEFFNEKARKMLKAMGGDIKINEQNEYTVCIKRTDRLYPVDIDVPADPSSAAFFAAAAVILPDSELVLKDVLINPTRDGFFRKIKQMGWLMKSRYLLSLQHRQKGKQL